MSDPILAPTADEQAASVAAKREQIAKLEAEIKALEAPAPVIYPKALYRRQEHGALETHVVKSEAEHKALEAGWVESPADCPKKSE